MKNLMLTVLLAFGIATVAQADTKFTAEESAVIMSEDFQKTLEALRVQRLEKGETIRVEGFYLLEIPPDHKYMVVNIVSKVSANINAPYTTIGNIVVTIKYGPMGEVSTAGAYFSPIPVPPGGTSIGNN